MSNRRKLRRSTSYASRVEIAPATALQQVLQGLEEMTRTFQAEKSERHAAGRAWHRGQEPPAAEVPVWPKDSVGDMFFTSPPMAEVAAAPAIAFAAVPPAEAIVANPAHWNVATLALMRAVVLDGLRVEGPAVRSILDVLDPVIRVELAYGGVDGLGLDAALSDGDLDFPEGDGPLFLVGGYALIDASWAAVADDALQDVLDVLGPALDGVHHGLAGSVIAEALIGAFARHYRCERPGDEDALKRIGAATATGNALEGLVAANAVEVEDVLRVGLEVLSRLAQLCRTGSSSVVP